MKKIRYVIFPLLFVLVALTAPVSASDVTYQIRSSVYDNTAPSVSAGDLYWDANSFSGFWYQVKPGLSSEVLYIHNTVNASSFIQLGDKIAEGDLYYVSKPQLKKTKIGGFDDSGTYIVDDVDLKKYYLIGFFGSQYLAMPEDPCSLSAGCNPDRIAKILMEQGSDAKKQMFSGEEWKLADGWSLVARQVDVEGNKVWVDLKKNGETVDSDVVSASANLTKPERTYLYKDNDDYPVFYCYADSIFRGATSDFVVFKYAFLRGDITYIESGDTYGTFDVAGFEVPAIMNGTDYAGSGSGTTLYTGDAALVMSSNGDMTLDPGETIDLYDGMYLKTEDTASPCLKMTLWKKCKITVPETAAEVKAVEEVIPEGETGEIIVIDMAGEGETEALSSNPESAVTSTTSEGGFGEVTESSVQSPGFGILVGIMGILGALRVQKSK